MGPPAMPAPRPGNGGGGETASDDPFGGDETLLSPPPGDDDGAPGPLVLGDEDGPRPARPTD